MSKKLNLLFVEDEPDINDVIGIALQLDANIQVHPFASAADVLQAVQSRDLTFQHALLDLRLPAMSGIELHKALRAMPGMADLRSIIITSAPEEETADVLGTPGIAGIIAKPFDALRLAAWVRDLFKGQESGARPRRIQPSRWSD